MNLKENANGHQLVPDTVGHFAGLRNVGNHLDRATRTNAQATTGHQAVDRRRARQ